MNDITDIVSRLRRTDENRGVPICSEAADTIERLRKERDEARRECCAWQGLESGRRKQDVAASRGWGYLRWPDPDALDRLAKFDEECGF